MQNSVNKRHTEITNGTPVCIRTITKTFSRGKKEKITALDGISLDIPEGTLTALVGPDGAGKTTLLRLIAGLMEADSGHIEVLGFDAARNAQEIQSRIGYMPQKFGLYEDLSIQENLDLYADLHGIALKEREEIFSKLLDMTNLKRFTGRLAGKLSGGMKQKLGLACTLVRSPALLLLDEPTVGVDPLSRRELWEIVTTLVREERMSVIVATSYLDEAEFGQFSVIMHQGRILDQGTPQALAEQAKGCVFSVSTTPGQSARDLQSELFRRDGIVDAVPERGKVRIVIDPKRKADIDMAAFIPGAVPVEERFEDGFMVLFNQAAERSGIADITLDRTIKNNPDHPIVEVKDLLRIFGSFTAVNHVSFQVRPGEIYGLLGPNGAGKSTTFRMLCGLLPSSGGTLTVAGMNLRASRAEARANLGYVAQKFSLYSDLSVDENLNFFACAYGLRGKQKEERIAWARKSFELDGFSTMPSGTLPGGYKQRLAMATALLHEPSILFLDEATSGADPLARREFWERIISLVNQGVTIIVTTHFMEEAEYCDRLIIVDGGCKLAEGTPSEIRALAVKTDNPDPTMEQAFISIVESSREQSIQ